MRTITHSSFLLALVVSVWGCAPVEPASDVDAAFDRTAAELVADGMVFGEIDASSTSLNGDSSLAVATRVLVYTSDGSRFMRRAITHIDGRGRFAVRIGARAVAEADAIVVVATDASGELTGAMVTEAAQLRTEVMATHRMTHETSVEALTYVRAQLRHGARVVVDQVDIRSRIDATVAATVEAAAQAQADGEAATLAMADVLADASVAAQATFQASLEAEGVLIAEAERLEDTSDAAAEAAVDASLSVEAAVDAVLASYALDASGRARARARAEAAFRAIVERAGTTDDEVRDASARASLAVEARARAAATGTFEASTATAADLRGGLVASLDDASFRLESTGEATADVIADVQADLRSDVRAAFTAAVDAMGSLSGSLGLSLGVGIGADAGVIADALLDLAARSSADLRADVEASAIAAVDVQTGAFDVEGFADATVAAWAEAEAELASSLAAVSDAELSSELQISASSLAAFELGGE